MGFADNNVNVLDPAAGTLSFIVDACQLSIDEYKNNIGDGETDSFIKNHIIKHFYGLELMMTPYVMGHLRMKMLLDNNEYKITDDRIRLALTNTLDDGIQKGIYKTPMGTAIERESACASTIKSKNPILAIIGNPPYSVKSDNKSDFINKEMKVSQSRSLSPLCKPDKLDVII